MSLVSMIEDVWTALGGIAGMSLNELTVQVDSPTELLALVTDDLILDTRISLNSTIRDIEEHLTDLLYQVSSAVDSGTGATTTALVTYVLQKTREIQNTIAGSQGMIITYMQDVKANITNQINAVMGQLGAIGSLDISSLSAQLTTIETGLNTMDLESPMSGALSFFLDDLVRRMNDYVAPGLAGISGISAEDPSKMSREISIMLTKALAPPLMPILGLQFDEIPADNLCSGEWQAVATSSASSGILGALNLVLDQYAWKWLKYMLQWSVPRGLLGASELITLRQRGLISTKMVEGFVVVPIEGEPVSKWGQMQRYQYLMKMHDLTEEQSELLYKISKYMPSIDDLFRLFVKEAFQDREDLKIHGEYALPADGYSYAKKIGVDSEWVDRFWHSHWQDVSPAMALEWFHRKIITKAQLEEYLKIGDWYETEVDRIIKASYTPITRVDIRRLFKDGYLTQEEVKKRYQFIGYSPSDAELMAQWTADDVLTEERDLTRTNVTNGYSKAVLTREDAGDMLRELGYDDDEAEYLLDWEDFKTEEERKALVEKAVKARLKARVITVDEAEAALVASNFTNAEVARILTESELEKLAKTRLLTKTDIKGMLDKGIFTEEQAVAELLDLGYSQVNALRLIRWWGAP